MDGIRQYQQMPLRIKRYFLPLTPPELVALLDNLDKLEKRVFNYLKYPEITYKNIKFLTTDERDKEFIEAVFIDLYSICDRGRIPFVRVVRHYEDHYKKYQRLHCKKPIDYFYFEAIKHIFFYLYEANKAIRDQAQREDYLERYGVKYYSEDKTMRIRQLGWD